MSVRRALSASCAVLLVAAAFAANASAKTPDLSGPKSFHRFPVYWAGTEIDGLPLEDISEGNGFTFFYGACELQGSDHPSCAPPVQIQVDSTCTRWASELNDVSDLTTFRGAKSAWHGVESGLEIFTGRVTIVIFVEAFELKETYGLPNAKKVTYDVAEQLHPIHQSKLQPLPPPAAGTLTGKLPCQKKTAKQFE